MNNNNNSYSDMIPNKQNINKFNEGKTNLSIRDKSLSYQYNGLGLEGNEHGYALSLACQSGTDIVHTVGNVSAIALQFILDQFPNNTFKTALPSTTIAHRQLRHIPKQIRTQPYPLCIINPRVSLSGLDNRLAAGSFATTTWGSISNRFRNRSEMEKLFFDKQKGIEWRGKINRTVIYFDFVLSFKSSVEQLRWASYLINKIPTDGRYFDIDTALEMALPDGFIEETARYAGIPVKDEYGSVSRFVNYLNTYSVFPVSYRFSTGRHKDAFYSYYMTSILCNINELQYTNVTKDNNLVETDCPITFTMRCEFNTIGLFDLSVPNPGPFRDISPNNSNIVIPIFSDVFNENDFPLLEGWRILARPICQLSYGENEIDISAIIPHTIDNLIKFHLENNIDVGLMLSVKLRENRCLIEDGYYVDWKRKTLVFTSVNFTKTYRMIIAVNQLYINNLLIDMYGKNN